jgi:hypothetical protein
MMTHPDQSLDCRDVVSELMRFFGDEVITWTGPDGQPVIQFATDEPAVVDLSSTGSGTVFVKAGDTGEVTTAEATSVEVGIAPVLVSSSTEHF